MVVTLINGLLMGYARLPFRNFESFHRTAVGLDGLDIRLILKHFNSNSKTYDIPLSIYSIEDVSEAVYSMGNHDGTFRLEYDDISMKKKLFKTCFRGIFQIMRFDENPFFNTLFGFTPY